MELDLLFSLGNEFKNLFVFAFILTRLKAVRSVLGKKPVGTRDKLLLSLIFGVFGILGSYLSVEFNGALINLRIIGVATGGILGGPLVGLLAGLIAAVHRWSMPTGTFTALACTLSTPLEGLVAGFLGKRIYRKNNRWFYAALIGALCESMRKIFVIIFSRPFPVALQLALDIWIPMVLINSFGLALLFTIIDGVFKESEKVSAHKVNIALEIADRTLPYFKMGLGSPDMSEVVKIILRMTDYDAVTLTDTKGIIAYAGMITPRHKVGEPIVTEITRRVLETGQPVVYKRCMEKGCAYINTCVLQSAIALPLHEDSKIVGTIKFYKAECDAMTELDMETCSGLAKLFSTQLTLGKLERNAQLLSKAELKVLQAQINPHFLFNSLTVIASMCRINPEKARDLIVHLSNFFRKNLTVAKDLVELDVEIEHVKSYVEIEKARFEDKLAVIYELDENVGCLLPPLTLQPLVENAIKHGILPQKHGGMVKITGSSNGEYVCLSVEDDGRGMSRERIEEILDPNTPHVDSIGIHNVDQRLKGVFGERTEFRIESQVGKGTTVHIRIPKFCTV